MMVGYHLIVLFELILLYGVIWLPDCGFCLIVLVYLLVFCGLFTGWLVLFLAACCLWLF